MPMEPNTAWLPPPPNAEPMSAPFPAWSSDDPDDGKAHEDVHDDQHVVHGWLLTRGPARDRVVSRRSASITVARQGHGSPTVGRMRGVAGASAREASGPSLGLEAGAGRCR